MTRIWRTYEKESLDWAWLDEIEVGDILLSGSGVERVVRSANYFKPRDRFGRGGKLYGITFVIQKCSWTHRCYTMLTRADLKTRKFTPTGKKKQTVDLIDKLIAHDILYHDIDKQRLDCCAVKGIR